MLYVFLTRGEGIVTENLKQRQFFFVIFVTLLLIGLSLPTTSTLQHSRQARGKARKRAMKLDPRELQLARPPSSIRH
jgi:hypothetical protein